MKTPRISIDEWIEKRNDFYKMHDEYLCELKKINIKENEEIDFFIEQRLCTDVDDYLNKYKDNVDKREKEREMLKSVYGIYYSSLDYPYYCIVSDTEGLDKVVDKSSPNYRIFANYIQKWRLKRAQNECRSEQVGLCIGLAFFVDDVYFALKNEKDGTLYFCLNICEYKPEEKYKIVTNGKDYL